MKCALRRSRRLRCLAKILAAAQVFASAPWASAASSTPAEDGAQVPSPAAASPRVKVHRSRPAASPVPALLPVFSAEPSDAEILQVRLFAEPLIPIAGTTSAEDNRALAQALQVYEKAGRAEAVEPLLDYLDRHPTSAWRAALLGNLGSLYQRTGYFTRALEAWEEAWRLGKGESEPRGRALVNGVLAQWAELNARLGRYEKLDEIFEEIDGRQIGGSAGEILFRVREGRTFMENQPGLAFRCGPYALEHIFAFSQPNAGPNHHLAEARSTKQGTSLLQMHELARVAGLDLHMVRRTGEAPIPLPALVHWKSGHFAALLESSGNLYRAADATFDGSFWVSREALNEEASGYFLVSATRLSAGWEPVNDYEASHVWGKGYVEFIEAQTPDEPDTCPCTNGNCSQGMANYSFKLLNIGLRVFDTPVGYTPPIGPPVRFEVDYNQRDIFQPANFTYSNLGPKWTFTWLSYIEDDPSNPSAAEVTLYARGGGRSIYRGMADNISDVDRRNQSVLERKSNPFRYERRLPDGSMEVFALPHGANPRKVFMTESRDPMGNWLTFAYNTDQSNLRLVSVTDAINQVTTLHYDLPADPNKITRVVDPFDRTAFFTYDTNLRLYQIVDVIGITSTFTYDDGTDFLQSLQTPYGTTTFSTGVVPGSLYGLGRWLEAVDPLLGKERVEFAQGDSTGIPRYDNPVPSGMPIHNDYLNFRNSFHWDKQAMVSYSPDDGNRYKKARIYHWLHRNQPLLSWTTAVAVLESEKKALESRVWYTYPNQPIPPSAPTFEGSIARPTNVGRVMDDGATQLYRYEYNLRGKVCKAIDPLGRETSFTYGTSNTPDADCTQGSSLDLLKIQQKNPAGPRGYDLLETRTSNDKHQPLTVTDASGQSTTYTYKPDGRLETVVTPPRAGLTLAQRTTTYSYYPDNAPLGPGRLHTVTGPDPGAVTRYTYDTYGRVKTMTPDEGDTLTYDYDALDRITKITFPDASYEEFTYDKLDLVRRRDRLGRVTRWVYDLLRRMKEVHEDAEVAPPFGTGLDRKTEYAWCSCGSLDKVIDPNGNETRFDRLRDVQGRVRFEDRDDGNFWEYIYEEKTSRLKQRKDARQQVTTYQYFLDDKLKQASYSNTQVVTPTVSFTYDPLYSRLATMTDGTGLTTYEYHAVTTPLPLGATRLKSADGPLSNDLVSYTYDELGRIKTRGLSASPISFTYDHLGRVTAVGSPIGSFNYGFSGSSIRPVTLTYPNGQLTEYNSFIGDPRRGIKYNSITHRAPGGGWLRVFDGYAYDLESNITSFSYHLGKPLVAPARNYGFTYDGLDRLIEADFEAVPGPPVVLQPYDYDLAGNRTLDGTTTSTYNNRNQLVSRDGVTYTYDANGNLASHTASPSGPARTFEWDAENRLQRILAGTTEQARFVYDGLGRRVQKVASGVTRDYIYDAERMVEERSGGVTRRLIDGPNVDQHLAQYIVSGSVSYLLTNHLGSVYSETDSAGVVTLSREYDPYGILTQGVAAGGHAFTGREWDPETGLYYYRARYYDPRLGRFISEDPIGLLGGSNRYVYVKNNPVNFRDPLGLFVTPGSGFFWDVFFTYDCATLIYEQVQFRWMHPAQATDTSNRVRHCIVECRISRECPGGRMTAFLAGLYQDPPFFDPDADPADRAAGATGRCLSRNPEDCAQLCLAAHGSGSFYR